MPRVKVSQACFTADGRYHYAGGEFDHDGELAPYMTEIGASQGGGSPGDPEVTVEDLRKKLADLGVKTAPQAGMKRLLEQLAEAEGRAA